MTDILFSFLVALVVVGMMELKYSWNEDTCHRHKYHRLVGMPGNYCFYKREGEMYLVEIEEEKQ